MNILKRIQNAFSRATIKLIDSKTKTQSLQIGLLAGEIKGNIEHMEPYGFTAHPIPGAEAIALFFGGDRSNGVVIVASDKRHRLLNLKEGEVAIYDDQGQKVVLSRSGIVVNTPKTLTATCGGDVTITAPKITLDAPDIYATGNIHASGDVKAGSISLNSHTHSGVESGNSSTGGPQ